MSPKAANEILINNISFRGFSSRSMGTILFMLGVDIPTPTLMDATFESVNTFLPELNGN